MAQLNTRLVLRNDTAGNWTAADVNSDLVLLKGEIGIEYDATGKVKMKVGDGTTNWSALAYFGGEEAKVYQVDSYDALPTTNVAVGDTGIVKTLISGDKYSYTGYVYTAQGWAAMDGNYNAENVYFDENILITTAVGNIGLTNGQGTIPAAGKNIKQVFEALWAKEDLTLTINQPTISLSVSSNAEGEVGSTFTRPTATLKVTGLGDYEYGSKDADGKVYTKANGTGVIFSEMKVGFGNLLSGLTDSNSKTQSGSYVKDNTATYTASATDIASNVFTDSAATYYFCGQATHTASVRKPVTNMGNFIDSTGKATDVYANGTKQIAQNTLKKEDGSKASWTATGYRNAFHGSKVSPVALESANIRNLSSNKASSNTLSVTVVEGAKQVIIAVPVGRVITKVADEAAFGTDIFEKFTKYTGDSAISVGGADATATSIGNYAKNYNVYVYAPSAALGANTYTVTVANG